MVRSFKLEPSEEKSFLPQNEGSKDWIATYMTDIVVAESLLMFGRTSAIDPFQPEEETSQRMM